MKKQNIILISVDEVRLDHLSCYGYERIKTENIDKVAEGGVLFETCIAAASLTPMCMSSVLCGAYPNKHTVRGPMHYIKAKTIAEILKDKGYRTAGFVGNALLGTKHGFNHGFGYYSEPTEQTNWGISLPSRDGTLNADEGLRPVLEGNWWADDMLNWLRQNHSSPFFIWGHYFETHEGAEKVMLRDGLIKEGVLSEFSYMDAKIKYMDENLVGRILALLEELNLWEDTILVIMSDHGTNVGEHPANLVPWRSYNMVYPQHTSLYDTDIRIALIIKGKNLPQGKRIKGVVRSADVIPTLLDFLEISAENMDFDGMSLLPTIEKGRAEKRVAYAESLYPGVSYGTLQALRTDEFKFIRDLSEGKEEFYNIQDDPLEQHNLIDEARKSREQELKDMRHKLNLLLFETKSATMSRLSGEEKEKVRQRMRALGYLE